MSKIITHPSGGKTPEEWKLCVLNTLRDRDQIRALKPDGFTDAQLLDYACKFVAEVSERNYSTLTVFRLWSRPPPRRGVPLLRQDVTDIFHAGRGYHFMRPTAEERGLADTLATIYKVDTTAILDIWSGHVFTDITELLVRVLPRQHSIPLSQEEVTDIFNAGPGHYVHRIDDRLIFFIGLLARRFCLER